MVLAANSFHTAEKERGEPGILCRLTARHELLGSHQGIHGVPSIPGRQQSFVHTGGIDICWVHQVINVLLPLNGHQQSSFIPGRQQSFVYTRSSAISCLYQGKASYSHQWPRCGERFLGLYTQRSDSWATCVSGAWASAIHSYGTILGSEFPLWDVHDRRKPFCTA